VSGDDVRKFSRLTKLRRIASQSPPSRGFGTACRNIEIASLHWTGGSDRGRRWWMRCTDAQPVVKREPSSQSTTRASRRMERGRGVRCPDSMWRPMKAALASARAQIDVRRAFAASRTAATVMTRPFGAGVALDPSRPN